MSDRKRQVPLSLNSCKPQTQNFFSTPICCVNYIKSKLNTARQIAQQIIFSIYKFFLSEGGKVAINRFLSSSWGGKFIKNLTVKEKNEGLKTQKRKENHQKTHVNSLNETSLFKSGKREWLLLWALLSENKKQKLISIGNKTHIIKHIMSNTF